MAKKRKTPSRSTGLRNAHLIGGNGSATIQSKTSESITINPVQEDFNREKWEENQTKRVEKVQASLEKSNQAQQASKLKQEAQKNTSLKVAQPTQRKVSAPKVPTK